MSDRLLPRRRVATVYLVLSCRPSLAFVIENSLLKPEAAKIGSLVVYVRKESQTTGRQCHGGDKSLKAW